MTTARQVRRHAPPLPKLRCSKYEDLETDALCTMRRARKRKPLPLALACVPWPASLISLHLRLSPRWLCAQSLNVVEGRAAACGLVRRCRSGRQKWMVSLSASWRTCCISRLDHRAVTSRVAPIFIDECLHTSVVSNSVLSGPMQE
jgi:hypothetical protein